MEKCSNCGLILVNAIEIYRYKIAYMKYKTYCEKCYKARIKEDKGMKERALNGGHL